MGFLSNDSDGTGADDTDDEYENTFKPIATDGERVLGYFNPNDGSGRQLVWVRSQAFGTITAEQIDAIV